MVRNGEDVQIIENNTGEDITSVTLAHIVLEQQKTNPSFPLTALRGIIQSGEEFFARLQWPVTQFKDEFRRRAEALEEGGKAIREFVDSTQKSVDEMQQRLDDRFRDTVDQLTHIPEMRKELEEMSALIEELQSRIEKLEEK